MIKMMYYTQRYYLDAIDFPDYFMIYCKVNKLEDLANVARAVKIVLRRHLVWEMRNNDPVMRGDIVSLGLRKPELLTEDDITRKKSYYGGNIIDITEHIDEILASRCKSVDIHSYTRNNGKEIYYYPDVVKNNSGELLYMEKDGANANDWWVIEEEDKILVEDIKNYDMETYDDPYPRSRR